MSLDSFSEIEKEELLRGANVLHTIFRNGPIFGNAYNLLIDEIIAKRNPVIKLHGFKCSCGKEWSFTESSIPMGKQ